MIHWNLTRDRVTMIDLDIGYLSRDRVSMIDRDRHRDRVSMNDLGVGS